METVADSDRILAIDAVDTLNDVIGDLIAASRVWADYHRLHKDGGVDLGQMSAIQKMCASHLVLAFAKLLEFWECYHGVVPDAHREELKRLNATLRQRGADRFRNSVAAHIWDRKLRRPVRNSEAMSQLETLVAGASLGEFLRWINNPENNAYPDTVVSIVEGVRDSLVAQRGIKPAEVIDR